MKLKAFQATNERVGRPLITLQKKPGLITITKSASKKIGLTAEDKVKFFHDEDSPKDWYITFEKENGFKIREKKGYDSGFMMNNMALMKQLIKTLNIPEDCNSFIIGSPTELDGVQYWPLLLNKF